MSWRGWLLWRNGIRRGEACTVNEAAKKILSISNTLPFVFCLWHAATVRDRYGYKSHGLNDSHTRKGQRDFNIQKHWYIISATNPCLLFKYFKYS
jgi:hypothetical protein